MAVMSDHDIARGQEDSRRTRQQAMEEMGWSEPQAAANALSPSHTHAILGMAEHTRSDQHAAYGWITVEKLCRRMRWHNLNDLTSLLYGLYRDGIVERDEELGWRLTALGCKAVPLAHY